MRARRVDANHSEIVRALRAIGCSVDDTSRVAGGFPDLTVGYRGRTLVLEVKSGAGKLTPAQVAWHSAYRGEAYVVSNVDQAIAVVVNHGRVEVA